MDDVQKLKAELKVLVDFIEWMENEAFGKEQFAEIVKAYYASQSTPLS